MTNKIVAPEELENLSYLYMKKRLDQTRMMHGKGTIEEAINATTAYEKEFLQVRIRYGDMQGNCLVYFDDNRIEYEDKETHMTMTTFGLADGEVEEIKTLYTNLGGLKSLIASLGSDVNDAVLDKLLARYQIAQAAYDSWFSTMQKKFGIETTPRNQWNVDFDKKQLQLL